MDGNKETVLSNLIHMATEKGFITSNDINCSADEENINIQDFSWVMDSLTGLGIIIDDAKALSAKNNVETDEYDDFAHIDYNLVYKKIVELDPSLRSFIAKISKILPPQYREIQQLKYLVQEGNLPARDRMIAMHLRMALKLALDKACSYDFTISEAIEISFIGLIMAVDKYNPDSSGAFASYAAFWIHQVLSRELPTKNPLIYYPAHRREGFLVIYPVLKEKGCIGCDRLCHCIHAKELITKKLDCDNKYLEDVINSCTQIESLDMFCENTEESFLLSKDSVEDEVEKCLLKWLTLLST